MNFNQIEVESLSRLKTSAFLGILGSVIVAVYSITYYLVFLPNALVQGQVQPLPITRFLIIPNIVVDLIAGVIQLLVFYHARQGFKGLSSLNIPTKNGITGATILMIFAIVGLLGVVPSLIFLQSVALPSLTFVRPGPPPSPSSLILLGILAIALLIFAIVGFVGLVLVIISEYSLGTRYGEGFIKLGSILQVIPFLNFIGYILLYLGFSNSVNKVRSGTFQAPQQSQPVYQVGLGTLSPSGVARFTLYSVRSVSITSASLGLLNQQVVAQSISTSNLNPGTNVIEVNFGPLQLMAGSYYVDLTLSDGTSVRVYVVLSSSS
ncbi:MULTISPECIES: DUF973 family protein [Metallosphaera]|uniref:DUF973 family protein n=2 Tax=Metallosphaera sedula TaxID=43687 RepID=A4YF72_METS5|nr:MULTISPECIES: DUF973 family protein [Metallosphaera]ABP95074.1 protein of unknown function DUF973 [Metallosphaera sedula DSM 5348]AIM27060.1 protein of unknown function DUF973 [Metallosphaera sedula]AKV73976.1 hypothetical protein MsedA_0918 [Metallosphaera sedula]AKV76215.1 hypothetical protein MsedB_0919 [Metallosphaera sedula]AKV78468.1 hypothetical protein MsedC_0918 [Metallosphaera sedula]